MPVTALFSFPCGQTRREFFWQMGNGFVGTALSYLLARDGLFGAAEAAQAAATSPLAARPPHFPARARACIFLNMVGGPSHLDTFDPKPALVRRHGQRYTFRGPRAATQNAGGPLKGSPFRFPKCGRSGLEISEVFPHLASCADELAILRGSCADSSAHGSASLQMNTGFIRQGFPALGSWLTYGLGTLNQNLPGFVVLLSGNPYSGAQNWGAGFMPAAYQGTVFNGSGEAVTNLRPGGRDARAGLEEQRRRIDLLQRFNEGHRAGVPLNSELAARIESYELAFRMQASAPEAVDLASETEASRRLYGIGQRETENFGRMCLLARRLVERGVRFVELFHANWDTHGDNDRRVRQLCTQIDRPVAGLLADLKRRGLLDETLVVWAGEFGRSSFGTGGRDHHAAAFSTWMAGGGIKGGTAYGQTDDLGATVADERTHVHDLHATILHLMGLDHERLTYRHAGRDYRLTDVHGSVIRAILA
jgi:hypothetical protein